MLQQELIITDNAAIDRDNIDNAATDRDNTDEATTSENNTDNASTGDSNMDNAVTGEVSIVYVPLPPHYSGKAKHPSQIKTLQNIQLQLQNLQQVTPFWAATQQKGSSEREVFRIPSLHHCDWMKYY